MGDTIEIKGIEFPRDDFLDAVETAESDELVIDGVGQSGVVTVIGDSNPDDYAAVGNIETGELAHTFIGQRIESARPTEVTVFIDSGGFVVALEPDADYEVVANSHNSGEVAVLFDTDMVNEEVSGVRGHENDELVGDTDFERGHWFTTVERREL